MFGYGHVIDREPERELRGTGEAPGRQSHGDMDSIESDRRCPDPTQRRLGGVRAKKVCLLRGVLSKGRGYAEKGLDDTFTTGEWTGRAKGKTNIK